MLELIKGQRLLHDNLVYSLCVSQDDTIVSGSSSGTIRIWDMNGRELANCRGHESTVYSLCVTADSKIVSGSKDRTVRMWNMQGEALGVCRGHEGSISSVCVTKDGKIISGSQDGTVRIWNMTGRELARCRHKNAVTSVRMTKDDKIISGCHDGTIGIWDMEGRELAHCKGHRGPVLTVCITDDGKIISGSQDRTVRIWDMNGIELAVCRGHEFDVFGVTMTADGKIISGSYRDVRMWNMTGHQIASLESSILYDSCLCVTGDNKILAGGLYLSIDILNSDGIKLGTYKGHNDEIRSICLTKHGKIVSASTNGYLRIWDSNVITESDAVLNALSNLDENLTEKTWTTLQKFSRKEMPMDEAFKAISQIITGTSMTKMKNASPSVKKEQVTLILGDEKTPMLVPKHHAMLIGAISELIDIEGAEFHTFPLPMISPKIGKLIIEQLERVYSSIHDLERKYTRLIIYDFKNLEGDDLIEVLKAVDYLNIPVLKKCAQTAALEIGPDNISQASIRLLPSHLRNPLVTDQVLNLLNVATLITDVCAEYPGYIGRLEYMMEDGTLVFNRDRKLIFRDIQGRELFTRDGFEDMRTFYVTKNREIISGTKDGCVYIFDKYGRELAVCRGHASEITSVCMSEDGKIISGSNDYTVRIWDMHGRELAVCRGHDWMITSVCITKDGKILSSSMDGTMRVWDLEGRELAKINITKNLNNVAHSLKVTEDGKIVYRKGKKIHILNMAGKKIAVCRGHQKRVVSVCVTKDGKIISGSEDNTVRIWDMNGEELAVCKKHNRGVNFVSITKDGKIVSNCGDHVYIWDMRRISGFSESLEQLSTMDDDQAGKIWVTLQKPMQKNLDIHEAYERIVIILKETNEDASGPSAQESQNSKSEQSSTETSSSKTIGKGHLDGIFTLKNVLIGATISYLAYRFLKNDTNDKRNEATFENHGTTHMIQINAS